MAHKKKSKQKHQNTPSPKNKANYFGHTITVKFKLTLTESNYEAVTGIYCSLYKARKWFNSIQWDWLLFLLPLHSQHPIDQSIISNQQKQKSNGSSSTKSTQSKKTKFQTLIFKQYPKIW